MVVALNQVESVPSVQESAATGEIAKIYADIRETLGTSVVNLVWRNLATLPGALLWTWSTVRPLYGGPACGHAEALRRTLPLPKLPPLSTDVLSAVGLGTRDIEQIREILDSYHHTNALALVTLSALLEYYEPGMAETVQAHDAAVQPARAELPPLPAMATLSPAVQRLITELNGFGEDDAPFLIASMYRHLAYWPSFLAIVRTMLAPLHADQSLAMLTHRARALGRAHGRALALQLRPFPPPPSMQNALASCRLFAEHPIARMSGICAVIRQAIGETAEAGEPARGNHPSRQDS
jgi:hypothetical protein